jgi:hypothetical protein
MAFVVAVIGFLGVLAALLWFTGWAEQEIAIGPDPIEVKTR